MEKDICENCEKYKTKKEQYLKECDSVFDAAAELYFFVHECEKVCTQAEEILKGENID